MKTLLVLAVFLASGPVVAQIISAGQLHTCAWDGRADAGVQCWGSDAHDLRVPPQHRNIRQLNSGTWHSCLIHESVPGQRRADCWGYQRSYAKFMERNSENDAVYVATGRWHTCGLFRDRRGDTYVDCGEPSSGSWTSVPADVVDPIALFSGRDYNCVLQGDSEIFCWGDFRYRQRHVEFRRSGVGAELKCSKTGDRQKPVECWINKTFDEQPEVRLNYGDDHVCTLTGGRVSCDLDGRSSTRDDLAGPIRLAVGLKHACAIDNEGIKCWGENEFSQLDTARVDFVMGPGFWGLGELSRFFKTLSTFVYHFESSYLLGVEGLLGGLSSRQKYFLLSAMDPYFTEFGYRATRDRYLLGSRDRMRVVINEGLSRQSLPEPIALMDYPRDVDNERIARSMLLLSLRAAKPQLSAEQEGAVDWAIDRLERSTIGEELSDEDLAAVWRSLRCDLSSSPYLIHHMTMNLGLFYYLYDREGIETPKC